MSLEEEYEPTKVTYLKNENGDNVFRFVWFSEWAMELWERLLGRLATDEEAAIENERYMRKPRQ